LTAVEEEDEDPVEERRRIFGEVDSSSESDEQDPREKGDREASDTDSVGNTKDEDEDEFLIVLQAVRERKKFEAEINRPMLKDKLSQTGWKIRDNFLKKAYAPIDERDRVDVFNVDPNADPKDKSGVKVDGRLSSNSDDVIILEY
jgi:hypothetical protein